LTDVRETLNSDVLIGWQRWRLPQQGFTARNSAEMATLMVTITWWQMPVGRCRVLGQRVEKRLANFVAV